MVVEPEERCEFVATAHLLPLLPHLLLQLFRTALFLVPQQDFHFPVALFEAVLQNVREQFLDDGEEVAVAAHVHLLVEGVLHLQVRLLLPRPGGAQRHTLLLVEDGTAAVVAQVDAGGGLVELVGVEPEDPFEDEGSVGLLLEAVVENVGDHEDDHGEGVESALVGDVEALAGEQFLHQDHHVVQGAHSVQPLLDSRCRDQSQVVALLRLVQSLHADIRLNRSAAVGPVQRVEDSAVGGVQAGVGSVDHKFDDGNGGRLDELEFDDPRLRLEDLHESLKGASHSLMFWQIVEEGEEGVVDGDVDVAVLDRDAARAAPEQSDRDAVVGQQELDALEGHHPSLEILVGLL